MAFSLTFEINFFPLMPPSLHPLRIIYPPSPPPIYARHSFLGSVQSYIRRYYARTVTCDRTPFLAAPTYGSGYEV